MRGGMASMIPSSHSLKGCTTTSTSPWPRFLPSSLLSAMFDALPSLQSRASSSLHGGPRRRKRTLQAYLQSDPSPSCGHLRRTTRTLARRSFLAELQNLREETNIAGPLEYESPLRIVLYPDPRLRAKNKRIDVFDAKLQQLVQEMFEVMYQTDGVGLSAPQVGVNVQLMVFNPEGIKGKGEEIVLVNPNVYKYSRAKDIDIEGCLSFPKIEADVERSVSMKVEAQDIKGKKFSLNLRDFPARIFQHEYDHLQGTLFFERMTKEVLDTICPSLEKLEEEYEKRTGLPAPEKISSGR